MASQMLGAAFCKAGLYPQCFSVFGGERRGAPLFSRLREDREKTLLKCNMKIPNQLTCFDKSVSIKSITSCLGCAHLCR